MTNVICAPDSFKECMTAAEAADAMAAGVLRARPDARVDRCPVADGGEGSLAIYAAATGATIRRAVVTGPLGERVEAEYGVSADGRTGIVELAKASGLGLVRPDRRDPTRTTTYGTGELIRQAIEAGCDRVIVFVGGSATCDGGGGIAQALGARLLDRRGRPLDDPVTGGALHRVARVEPARPGAAIVVACDVANPLTGPDGAAAVYGPQKGATPAQVGMLDAGLARLAASAGGDPALPGAGAAGGTAYGLAALCGATLARGVDIVLDSIGFAARCADATLVLTGEGRLEAQTAAGKACHGVAMVARTRGVPAVAIVGSEGDEVPRDIFKDVVSLEERYGRERAIAEAKTLITEVVAAELSRWT